MSPAFILYLIDLIGNFNVVIVLLLILTIIILLFFVVGFLAEYERDDNAKVHPFFSKLIKLFFVLSAISIILPSEKTMYMMVGASYLNNSEVPAKVERIINDKLDEIIKKDGK